MNIKDEFNKLLLDGSLSIAIRDRDNPKTFGFSIYKFDKPAAVALLGFAVDMEVKKGKKGKIARSVAKKVPLVSSVKTASNVTFNSRLWARVKINRINKQRWEKKIAKLASGIKAIAGGKGNSGLRERIEAIKKNKDPEYAAKLLGKISREYKLKQSANIAKIIKSAFKNGMSDEDREELLKHEDIADVLESTFVGAGSELFKKVGTVFDNTDNIKSITAKHIEIAKLRIKNKIPGDPLSELRKSMAAIFKTDPSNVYLQLKSGGGFLMTKYVSGAEFRGYKDLGIKVFSEYGPKSNISGGHISFENLQTKTLLQDTISTFGSDISLTAQERKDFFANFKKSTNQLQYLTDFVKLRYGK